MELGAKSAPVQIKLLPIEPLHRLRAVEGTFDEIRAELADRAPFLQEVDSTAASTQSANSRVPSLWGEYLSLTLSDRRVTPELAEDLRSLCESKGILLMELSSGYQEARSVNGLTAATLRELSLSDLFADFYSQRSAGTEPDEAELRLLQKAAALAERADLQADPDPQAIAELLQTAKTEVKK